LSGIPEGIFFGECFLLGSRITFILFPEYRFDETGIFKSILKFY